jgi:outer membrane lipoprotein carrier protein
MAIVREMMVGLILTLFFLLPTPSAWAVEWEGWDAFRETSRRITSIDSPFVQKKTLPILAKPFVSSGRFFYQPPGSLRWEYERPVRSVLMMHEGKVKRYLREKDAWREDASAALPTMQTVLNEIVSWQQGRFDTNPHFQASLMEGPEPRVILVPKEASWRKMIQQIEIVPSREQAGVIKSVRMMEDERTFTVLEFGPVRLNRSLPVSLFVNVE